MLQAFIPMSGARRWVSPLLMTATLLGQAHGETTDAAAAAAPGDGLQTVLLNACLTPTLHLEGWKMSAFAQQSADGAGHLGGAAVAVTSTADIAGAKVDLPLFDGELAGCHRLTLWVSAPADANVTSVGFQVLDADGEWLMQTVPLDSLGWKKIELDPAAH